jgi:hypothetical protein
MSMVTVIPLAEYAPDEASMAALRRRNPFNDEKDVAPERLGRIWQEEIEANGDAMAKRNWKPLAGWRDRCPQP